MKRIVVLMMVLGLVLGAVAAADAGKKKKKPQPAPSPTKITREASATYVSTAVVAAGGCGQADAINCPRLPGGEGELYVSAKVTDVNGQKVAVAVKADLDGNGNTEKLYGVFCGETTEPIMIDEGAEVTFWIGISPDTATLGCAPGTKGTVDAVFSNMP